MSRGLIVVDVQNDFCEGGSVPVSGGARIATKIADLVERSAGRDYQYVVATRDHHIDPGSHFSEHPDFKDSFPVHCVAGGEGGSSTRTSRPLSPAARSTPSSSKAPTAPPRAASKARTSRARPSRTGCAPGGGARRRGGHRHGPLRARHSAGRREGRLPCTRTPGLLRRRRPRHHQLDPGRLPRGGHRRIRRDARNAIALSRRTTSSSCRARRAEVRGSGRRPCPCGRGRRCPESGRDQAEQGPRSGTGFTPA